MGSAPFLRYVVRMYGYIIAVVVGLVLVGLVVGQLSRPRPPRRGETFAERKTPSADAPTPGESATATEREKQTADRHTPAE